MSTIVIDADALIKMGKCGALEALVSSVDVLVPEAVWEEAVEEGKRRMYEDAFILERVIEKSGTEVVGHGDPHGPYGESEQVKQLLAQSAAFFGAGERATLAVFFERDADAILSDDATFLRVLAEAAEPVGPIPVLVPTATIVGLAERRRLTIEEARAALEKIEPFVRDEAYRAALGDLDALEEGNTEGKTEEQEEVQKGRTEERER